MSRIVFAVITVLLLIAVLPGCSKSEPTPTVTAPAFADTIAEKLILAYDANDYTAYLINFDEVATGSAAMDWFSATSNIITQKIGHYIPASKVLTEVNKSGNYTEVVYNAKYSDTTDNVFVTVRLEINEKGTFAAGVWFNSRKLFVP
ncbi:MAG: hypothetical protein ACYDG5_04260 [Dehalococcoidales bacterium]